MTETTCPVCTALQPDGLMCHACTTRLEQALGDVRWIVTELDTTLSRQAKIGTPAKGGLAREKTPIHWGAVEAGTQLLTVLDAWARGIVAMHATEPRTYVHVSTATSAAAFLLGRINELRRHPDVDKLMLEVTEAVQNAHRVIDRAANRTVIFVGPCPEPDEHGQPCLGEVHAYIPTEDNKPSRMQCKYDGEHKWDSTQWLRAGKRIADLAQTQRNEARSA